MDKLTNMMYYGLMIEQCPTVEWNPDVKLVFADVDDTIAPTNGPADPEMIEGLNDLLDNDVKLFFITGSSIVRVTSGVANKLDPELRRNVLIGPCSGVETWGFDDAGELHPEAYYNTYDSALTSEQKGAFRDVVERVISEFGLIKHGTTPKPEFWEKFGKDDPRRIMFADRTTQITIGAVNGKGLSDDQAGLFDQEIPRNNQGDIELRIALVERARKLLLEGGLPISARIAGGYSVDMTVEGVSKATAVDYVLNNPAIIDLSPEDVSMPGHMEVWGDRFSVHGGTDQHMSEALPTTVRSIDFRDEHPDDFPEGYDIVLWDGEERLHHGTLEYLKSRG